MLLLAFVVPSALALLSYEHVESVEGLDFELRWTIDASDVHVALTAGTLGWVGLGFADPGGGGMKGADMVIGWADANGGGVEDRWSSAYSTPHLDTCQDWSLVSAFENETHTTIEVTRARDTGDLQDRVVGASMPNRLVAAFGFTDTFGYHGTTNRRAFRLAGSTFDELEAMVGVERYDFTFSNYVIPTQETTYEEQCFDVPEEIGVVHLVGLAPLIQASTAKYVHHFVLTGFFGAGCTETQDSPSVADCEPGDFTTFYCSGGELELGRQCQACGDYASCVTSTSDDSFVAGLASCDTSTANVSLTCSSQDVLTATFCATGTSFTITNPEQVCSCANNGGDRPGQIVYVWAPGGEPLVLPDEAGFRVNGDRGFRSLELSTHYNNVDNDVGQVDNSGVTFLYTSDLRQYDAGIMTLGDYRGDLYGDPVAQESGLAHHRFSCGSSCTSDHFGDSQATIFGTMHHMHGTGTRMTTRHYSNSGSLQTTLNTEYYDFDFQDEVDAGAMTGFDTFLFHGGDSFVVDCYYDERDVAAFSGNFGRASEDEMCDLFLMYFPTVGNNSFDCRPSDCEEYCGPEFLDTPASLDRLFGTPCDQAPALKDYSVFDGCATGVPIVVVDDDKNDNETAQDDAGDDNEAAQDDTGDDTSSDSKKSSSSSNSWIIGVAVGAGIVALLLALGAWYFCIGTAASSKSEEPAVELKTPVSEAKEDPQDA